MCYAVLKRFLRYLPYLIKRPNFVKVFWKCFVVYASSMIFLSVLKLNLKQHKKLEAMRYLKFLCLLNAEKMVNNVNVALSFKDNISSIAYENKYHEKRVLF